MLQDSLSLSVVNAPKAAEHCCHESRPNTELILILKINTVFCSNGRSNEVIISVSTSPLNSLYLVPPLPLSVLHPMACHRTLQCFDVSPFIHPREKEKEGKKEERSVRVPWILSETE